jgi:hypothetical protein
VAGTNAEWIDAVLRAGGHLPTGRVVRIDVIETETTLSQIQRIEVTYSSDAPVSAPFRLFLKLPKPEARYHAHMEVAFYTEMRAPIRELPLVTCYCASPAGLLLADVSETHVQLSDAGVTLRTAEPVVRVLAQLHAMWWGRRNTGESLLPNFDGAEQRYSEFVNSCPGPVPSAWKRAYDRLLAQGRTRLAARLSDGRHLTLCHPDAHGGNFLVPRPECNADGVYIVDWHVYVRWWGAHDLARFIFFEEEIDPPARSALLKVYYNALLDKGIADYPWSSFWNDYRLSFLEIAIFALFYQPDLIRHYVDRAMGFYSELDCDALFDGREP